MSRSVLRAMLKDELLSRYETSAGEDNERRLFTCRRCLATVGWDQGTDDMAGLCDACWCVVDERLRGGRPHGIDDPIACPSGQPAAT